MSRNRKILFAKFALILTAVPLVIYGFASGPEPFVTGDPKAPDNGATCNQSSCHVGTAVNGGAGKVQITLPGAPTYVPGQAQQISVTVSDPAQRAWGFELTSRALTDNSQAGDLTSTDGSTFVQCADGGIKRTTCASGLNVQFVQHTAPKTGSGSGTFTFKWTPPSTSAGTIVLYVAGNAANGDANNTGDHIYTSSVQLTPAAASNQPSITGVQNGASFQSTIAPNTYIQIKGQNLSSTPDPGRVWTGNDFTVNADKTLGAPISLDGTSVTVNGVPAYVYYVSPIQLNVITPNIPASGNGVPVIVTVNGQSSAPFSVTLLNLAPSFFEWLPATADLGKYLLAEHVNGSFVGKVGLYPGTSSTFTTPAKPGETLVLFGTGFGLTSPPMANGIETDKVYNLSPNPTATLGSIPAVVGFAGLIRPFFQVYQFNVTVPASTPDGDWPLVVNVNGTLSFSGLITVLH